MSDTPRTPEEILAIGAAWITEAELEGLVRALSAAQSRVELLEHDMKSGDYETLYAQTVQELAAARAECDALRKCLTWLEDNHTLHRNVKILYVVDGYEVTLMDEDSFTRISPTFRGDDLQSAIDAAMREGK